MGSVHTSEFNSYRDTDMPKRVSQSGSELFIVDNSNKDWKVLRYLHDWCQLSKSIDIATGYFEIGSLLALKDEWRQVDKIRILMGDEVSKRTKSAFEEGMRSVTVRLDDSLEAEKAKNDFLVGVPTIVDAIKSGQIECRVYRKDKFHAKAYITHARQEVIGSFGLVGSSNLTYPGLTENIELNVQITGTPVKVLQEWYEEHWAAAEDVSPEILRTVERHIHEYSPFEVYAKSLQEFFRGHEMTADEWELTGPENGGSHMYSVLDQYQKEGYHNLLKIAKRRGGTFLCDGVGLGKTYIGLMLIERLIRDRQRVMLIVPKAAREAVWEPALRQYLQHLHGDFSNLAVFSHTDLQRGGEYPPRFDRMKEMADAVIIDEAHHFRNPGTKGETAVDLSASLRPGRIKGKGRVKPSRYRLLYDLIEGTNGPKRMYMLTATPINNKLADFRYMTELFSRKQNNYFESIGIHSLRGHFLKMERALKKLTEAQGGGDVNIDTDLAEAEALLRGDDLFHALVVQRSRAYVKQSQLQHGIAVTSFPEREPPKVADYSVKKTYGRLLDLVEKAFNRDKPLFSLAIYYPLGYYKGPDENIDLFEENRQKQVIGLIRVQFLKRFESSARAFERSCERLLIKLLIFVTRHAESDAEKRRLDRWKRQNADRIDYVSAHQLELWGDDEADETMEDLVTEEMLEDVEHLDPAEYRVDEMLDETYLDLDQVVRFLEELGKFKPRNDDKLKALLKLLKSDPVMKKQKVLLFTEYADTAKYLTEQLKEHGIEGLDQIDSSTKRSRMEIIRAFAPYYNGSSSADLREEGVPETRVLISTDVLSEGLNLQDATRLINYDIHWNPVRLMQRVGRVDRRMNPEVEARLVADHPDQKKLRGKITYWNFLPPDELDRLLRLYGRVAHKTLRISRTFGVEGRKLLRPEDDYDALKEFNSAYEGTTTPVEQMHLEYQKLLQDHPSLEDRLNGLPLRVFSGKEHPSSDARAVFFCYALPARPTHIQDINTGDLSLWTEEAGDTKWYLFDLATEKIADEPGDIVDLIRSEPDTPRHCAIEQATLSEIRAKIEKYIKNTYLKQVQAPIGVKPTLKCWMELS